MLLPWLAAVATIVDLFAIGNVYDVSFLLWHFYSENGSDGSIFELKANFAPFFAGLLVLFATQRLLKHKEKKTLYEK